MSNLQNKAMMDSREVAELVGKNHSDLLKSIVTYDGYLAKGKFLSLDFFIPSTYLDSQGKERPCYLLTKMGCEMVANKMTGEKGVLFTATYVKRFNDMEQEERQLTYEPREIPVGEINNLVTTLERQLKAVKSSPHKILKTTQTVLEQFKIRLPEDFLEKPIWEVKQIDMFELKE